MFLSDVGGVGGRDGVVAGTRGRRVAAEKKAALGPEVNPLGSSTGSPRYLSSKMLGPLLEAVLFLVILKRRKIAFRRLLKGLDVKE